MQNRLLSLLLALALIVSLSVTTFASGEQPSGTNYSYWSGTALAKSDFWSALTLSAYNLGREFHNTFSGSYSTVSSSGTTSSNSSFWTATTNSLANIGFMLKYNSFTVDTEWTPSSISSVQTDLASVRSSSSNIELDVDSIKQDVNQIADIDLSTIEQNTTTTATNSNTLLSVLGTPSEGSTFWNNQSQINTRLNTFLTRFGTFSDHNFYYYTGRLHSRMAPLESDYTWFNGNQISSNTTNWFGSVASSLKGLGVRLVHVDDDFHSLHDKIGSAIDEGSTIFSLLTDLHTVFASPEDLEMHNNNSENYAQANDDFFTGQDSSTSIGTGSLSGLKDFGSSAGQFLGTNGVSPTEVFTIISDGTASGGFEKPWVWFDQGNKNDLEETVYDGNGNRKNSNLKSRYNSPVVYDLYSEHQADFYKALGGLTDG